MPLASLFRVPASAFLAGKLFNSLGGFLVGGATLWWVAAHAGPTTGTAIVHVAEPHVVVSVGGRIFQVEDDVFSPLICDLPAGEHRLLVTRGEAVLLEETFTVRGGEDRVLAAWRPRPEGPHRPEKCPGTGSRPRHFATRTP